MANNYLIGGPGVCELYTIVANAATTLAIRFDETNGTTIAYSDGGVATITIDNELHNAAFSTWKRAALPLGTSSTPDAERTRENGTKVGGGGASGATKYVAIMYGPTDSDGTNRLVWVGVVSADSSTGGWHQKAGEATSPTVSLKSFPADADTTIDTLLFDDTLVTVTVDQEIPEDSPGEDLWLTAA